MGEPDSMYDLMFDESALLESPQPSLPRSSDEDVSVERCGACFEEAEEGGAGLAHVCKLVEVDAEHKVSLHGALCKHVVMPIEGYFFCKFFFCMPTTAPRICRTSWR